MFILYIIIIIIIIIVLGLSNRLIVINHIQNKSLC